jgi:hypothetical protein
MVSSVSEEFVVRNTSDPLTSFHLTSIFDAEHDEAKEVQAMDVLAKTQVLEWSKGFVEYAKSSSVLINFYYGDAITFCHELASSHSPAKDTAAGTRAYTAQWSCKPSYLMEVAQSR